MSDEKQVVDDPTPQIKIRTVYGFRLTLTDTNQTPVTFDIRSSDYAEQLVRGFVHSGFTVTIMETDIQVSARDQPAHTLLQRMFGR